MGLDWHKDRNPQTASRAVGEYMATLDDTVGAASAWAAGQATANTGSIPGDQDRFVSLGRRTVSMPMIELSKRSDSGSMGQRRLVKTIAYEYEVQAGLSLQPNVQYIRHPGGGATGPFSQMPDERLRDATVFGLRTVVKF